MAQLLSSYLQASMAEMSGYAIKIADDWIMTSLNIAMRAPSFLFLENMGVARMGVTLASLK